MNPVHIYWENWGLLSLLNGFKTSVQVKGESESRKQPSDQVIKKKATWSSQDTMKLLLLTILSFSLTASLPTDLVHKSMSNSTTAPQKTTTTTTTTTPKQEPCINHVCQREGLFPEGPCDEVFCQCQCFGNQCSGVLQHCFEGTFFHAVIHVCDFPWNIPACTEQETDEKSPNMF